MKIIGKVVTVAFLATLLMVWSSPSEARKRHRESGHGHHYGQGHRSHGYHGYRGKHHYRSRHYYGGKHHYGRKHHYLSRHYYGGKHHYRGRHHYGGRHRHYRHGYYFAPFFSYGYGNFYHRPHHYNYGHRSHFGIVLNFHNALEYSPTHETSTWRNPDTYESEAITPVKTYQTREGRYCREYIKTVTINGEQRQAYGTACRQPDGNWVTVNR